MNENAINELKEIILRVKSNGGVVSDVKYIGMGIYQGVTNGRFEISFDDLANICRILDLTVPTIQVWDSERGRIQQHGCHSHSLTY